MDHIVIWSVLGTALILCLGYSILKSFHLLKLQWWNLSRLSDLKKRHEESAIDPADKKAVGRIIDCCESLRAKWILSESDLRLLENTHQLAMDIAGAYHPSAPAPLAEARIGPLLRAFLDLKNRITGAAEAKSLQAFTQFRLRHILFLAQAWEKKKEWESSAPGTFLKKYRIYVLVRWAYFLVRWMDISFWSMKMLTYLLYNVVFKIFLVRWYLMVGELSITVYRERGKGTDIQQEIIFEDFEAMPDLEEIKIPDLPQGVRNIVDVSRKQILFNPWALEWQKTREIYRRMVEDIAHFHHPNADRPIYEAKLSSLMAASARFAGKVFSLQNLPLINKALDLKVSHILWVKDTADIFKDSQLAAWLKKYKLQQVIKYSSLIFKAVKKRHPGLIFKDFAFSLVKEGGKRWVYLYLHEKIAGEANATYREESRFSPIT
ncbi:MAG: hypothetical protein ACE5G9_11190 [Nitrospinales bacterium]